MGSFDNGPEGDEEFSIEELSALALGADPNPVIAADAKPFVITANDAQLLPQWYMPAMTARLRPGWRAAAVLALVGLLVGIELSGLCSAFGQLVVG